MDKKEKKLTVENIAVIISIIICIHYYLSYKWLYGLLKIWEIESLSIITLEDLIFPFANLNITVILLSIFGFIGIFCWHLLRDENSTPAKNLSEAFLSLKNWFIEKSIWTKLILIISIIILVTSYILIFKPQLDYPSNKIEILYFFILIGVPILYIFIDSNKKSFILGFQFFLMFGWANLFVNSILEEATETRQNSKIKSYISFTYKEKTITTADSLKLLFHGHKYLILSNKNKEIELYDTKNIDNITIKKTAGNNGYK